MLAADAHLEAGAHRAPTLDRDLHELADAPLVDRREGRPLEDPGLHVGDFLIDAQGEDVVSGVRTPRDLSELRDWMPAAHAQLLDIMRRLERHYGDMQDTEFTIEDGRLY